MENLFRLADAAIRAADPDDKLRLSEEAGAAWREGRAGCDGAADTVRPIAPPGRPERLRLVPPLEVPRRRPGSEEGRAAQLHALAHIEFDAINLAWDAVYRFRGLPPAYYADWVQVAVEEAHHFRILRERLRELGYDYTDFAAHDGLWQMAQKTAEDPLLRMALVPRLLEARALEAVPRMMAALRRVEDYATAGLLETIMADEIGHVAAGSRWFKQQCAERGLDPAATYRGLLAERRMEHLKGPLNREARLAAGFDAAELAQLEELAAGWSGR